MRNDILWAPWRASFVLSKKEKGCVFCRRLKEKDTAGNLIVYRGKRVFVILNKYPYNAGHALVVPNRHIGHLEQLRPEESIEFFEVTRLACKVIKKALKPQSLNLGMNLGKASGAGVPGHLHMHIVPRWTGDTNFMPVIGKTKLVSVPLEAVYERIRAEFAKV
jgi:ATP adenylyltransferase